MDDRRPLTEAELLLGSFFFIHKSKAGEKEQGDHRTEGDTAFEFLHSTFGEFLTAAFILRVALQETEALHTLKHSESLRAEYRRKIHHADGLVKEWFVCLMYAPLYSRPVVLEMLREWANHVLRRERRDRNEFIDCLDEIVRSQIALIVTSKALPSMLCTDEGNHFANVPLLGCVAIYTMNLVTLRTP